MASKQTSGNPSSGVMVLKALETLEGYSSLQAIKKYISESYGVTVDKKQGAVILRSLKAAIGSGKVVKSKASYKLAGSKSKKKSLERKPAKKATDSKSSVKKAAAPKKKTTPTKPKEKASPKIKLTSEKVIARGGPAKPTPKKTSKKK